jgi:hypothetical protein
MKTKNFLLTGALLIMALFSVNGVMAEGPSDYVKGQTFDNVTVNLIFKPIQSIQVNTDQKSINFEYSTPQHYIDGLGTGRTQEKIDHLTVYHSGGFDVKVASSGFKKGEAGDQIANDHVKVFASKGSNIATDRNNFDFTTKPSLSAGTGKQFFSSTGGGMGMNFNVTYELFDTDENRAAYLDFTNGTTETTYTAEVTYTIVSK